MAVAAGVDTSEPVSVTVIVPETVPHPGGSLQVIDVATQAVMEQFPNAGLICTEPVEAPNDVPVMVNILFAVTAPIAA